MPTKRKGTAVPVQLAAYTAPATAGPITTRETWRDWLGPDEPDPEELFTRDEMAAMASGVDLITGDDLRYCEYQGVLPRSIRKWHNGGARAVYPQWYVSLARNVRQLQRQGLSLAEIRPQIREYAHHLLNMDFVAQPLEIPSDVQAGINTLAQHLAHQANSPVSSIEVSITLEDGSGTLFAIPVTSNGVNRNLQ